MGTLGIISLILGVLGLAAGVGTSVYQNQQNVKAVQDTNDANLQAVRETNASNVQQAELAYQRSLPINQVNNLVAAGMSKSAAINSLTGGGTYQAPILQSAHADAPQVDYSGVASAMERLGNIPSNAEQYNIQQQQRKNLEQEFMLREKDEQRKQEMHNALIDEKNYSKWERETMDSFMSLMENTAQEKNIQPSPNQSMHDYVRALGLQDNEMYKSLPVSCRQRAFDKFKQIQDERRTQIESNNKYNLDALETELKMLNLSENERASIIRLGILANNFDASNFDKSLRDAGFKDKHEAAKALASAEKYEARERNLHAKNVDSFNPNFKGYLQAVGYIVDSLLPFKHLFK